MRHQETINKGLEDIIIISGEIDGNDDNNVAVLEQWTDDLIKEIACQNEYVSNIIESLGVDFDRLLGAEDWRESSVSLPTGKVALKFSNIAQMDLKPQETEHV